MPAQWITDTRSPRKSFQAARDGRNRTKTQRTLPSVRTTEEIAATLRTSTAEKRLNHSVALAEPLDLPEADLVVPPYVLGAWLGDGTSAEAQITTADDEMVISLRRSLVVTVLFAMLFPTLPRRGSQRECVVCVSVYPAQSCEDVSALRRKVKGTGESLPLRRLWRRRRAAPVQGCRHEHGT